MFIASVCKRHIIIILIERGCGRFTKNGDRHASSLQLALSRLYFFHPSTKPVHAQDMSVNHYDQNLLGAAPEATKEQRQEGYDVDLLTQNQAHQGGNATPPDLTPRSTDVETALRPKEYNNLAAVTEASRISFFQSTKGKIAIVIVIIVIIGAVVGGAVGGTVGKHKNNNSSVLPSSNTTSNSSNTSGNTTEGSGSSNSTGSGAQNSKNHPI